MSNASVPGVPRPAEAVAEDKPALEAVTEAAHNEPAPASGPELPPRNYDASDTRLLRYTPPAPPLPRDRTLVRFFRFLAALLFWGGSATSLAVVFYRRVVLPRLAILASRLGALHAHHLTHYTKFVDETRRLAAGNDLLCPKTAILAKAVETPLPADGVTDEAVQATGPVAEELTETSRPPSVAGETSEKAIGPEPEASISSTGLCAPVVASLSVLRAEVTVNVRSEEDEGVSPPKRLVDSLELLSSYITTQTFHATQTKLNLGGGGYNFGQVPGPNGTTFQQSNAGEAAAQCGAEVRGLKGLLLNRRNFALLERWDDDGEANLQ